MYVFSCVCDCVSVCIYVYCFPFTGTRKRQDRTHYALLVYIYNRSVYLIRIYEYTIQTDLIVYTIRTKSFLE